MKVRLKVNNILEKKSKNLLRVNKKKLPRRAKLRPIKC